MSRVYRRLAYRASEDKKAGSGMELSPLWTLPLMVADMEISHYLLATAKPSVWNLYNWAH